MRTVYDGDCSDRSPLYNSQVPSPKASIMCNLACIYRTLLIFMTVTLSGPKHDHYRQVPVYTYVFARVSVCVRASCPLYLGVVCMSTPVCMLVFL